MQPSEAAPDRVWVRLGGEPFELELALFPATRHRGLSGRASIDRNGGMLFVFPEPGPLAFIMRDCFVPIDIAFLDAAGSVVATHEMQIESPRRPDEPVLDYEARLRRYPSRGPAQFAIETAGGRLAELRVRVGQRIRLDGRSLIGRAR